MNSFHPRRYGKIAVLLVILTWPAAARADDISESGKAALRMLEGVSIFGDMRVRYEGVFDDTTIGDNHGRFRLRLGLKKSFGNFASLTFRGASGSEAIPTSPNQTFTGNFTPKSFNIDQAYGVLRPAENFEILGGKMPTPFFATDLLWDGDLNPEGLAQKIHTTVGRQDVSLIFGQFIFNSSAAAEDGYLLGFQAVTAHEFQEGSRVTVAPAVTQIIRPNATLVVGLNGNLTNAAGTALNSDFQIVNIPVRFETAMKSGTPISVDFDYAHNHGAKSFNGKTYGDGYLAEVSAGRAKKRGDWMAKYRYARIEPDAVLSAFNDSDFSFTDTKGHRVRLNYVAWDFLQFSATGFFLKPVRPNVRPDRSRIQIDATLSF